MKFNKIALAVGVLMVSGSAAAEFSANIGATSNYVWRGLSQTGDSAAISGGIDYAHDGGFYAGTWVSNVDFDDASGGQAELDLYGGFGNELDNGLGYDVGAIYYAYPAADKPDDKIDFAEIYGSLSYRWFTGGINYTVYKEDSDADTGDVYYFINGATDIAQGWGVGGTIGYYDFRKDSSYTHFQLDVTKSAGDFGDFTLSLSKVADRDLGVDEDLLAFVSWGKTFD